MSAFDRYSDDPYYLPPREQKLVDEMAAIEAQLDEARAVASKLSAALITIEECIAVLESMRSAP